jgi:hypothetical protein
MCNSGAESRKGLGHQSIGGVITFIAFLIQSPCKRPDGPPRAVCTEHCADGQFAGAQLEAGGLREIPAT